MGVPDLMETSAWFDPMTAILDTVDAAHHDLKRPDTSKNDYNQQQTLSPTL